MNPVHGAGKLMPDGTLVCGHIMMLRKEPDEKGQDIWTCDFCKVDMIEIKAIGEVRILPKGSNGLH